MPLPADTADRGSPEPSVEFDATESAELLLRDLRSSRTGLSTSEAQRRLLQYGPNQLRRRGGVKWPGELARQLTHPLALLLWLAAALSFAVGSQTIAVAVLLVILLNALFAFIQEMQAERAVEALAQFLPQHVTVLRDGAPASILAADLVPGDIVLVEEGDRIAADMRLISGGVEVDISTLTGESAPVLRSAELIDTGVPRIEARDLLFSGTSATGGEAQGLVFATGMHTELGRIAALSERVKEEPSPLERQVRKVAWLIAAIAIAMAVAFVPVAIFGAGLSFTNSVVFAVGLLAGNVPEGLLPVITLALAVAVRLLARRGALVKRLSAVETLGSTDVICTDKTGTLTQNQMRPVAAWTLANEIPLDPDRTSGQPPSRSDAALSALAETAAACNNAHLNADGNSSGDPTEIALLIAAQTLSAGVDAASREHTRAHQYNFDAQRKLMSTIDTGEDHDWLHTKGAPESVLPRCTTVLQPDGEQHPMQPTERERVTRQVESFARQGLRVLALAHRRLEHCEPPLRREDAERELCLLGLITMRDPPRPEVA
ncbi:MAG: HAD-IC family P-type ATPase, partial [Solirubrobacteraceae bacterium]